MIKILNIDELKKYENYFESGSEEETIIKQAIDDMNIDKNIIVKLKITKHYSSLVIYKYDKSLYRYIISNAIYI